MISPIEKLEFAKRIPESGDFKVGDPVWFGIGLRPWWVHGLYRNGIHVKLRTHRDPNRCVGLPWMHINQMITLYTAPFYFEKEIGYYPFALTKKPRHCCWGFRTFGFMQHIAAALYWAQCPSCMLRIVDSNHWPQGYEPCKLPSAPMRYVSVLLLFQ